ncbi:IS3 family transposase [Pendulispora rubella]|uniref:IS3 family transposase n=1 Tax=Pendulispora rubella TaxID=2741070 RepID=A0ABZ2LDI9_9BACT
MKFAFIDVEKTFWPIQVLCFVLGVSRSGYYAWKARPKSESSKSDEKVAAEIAATHERSRGTYGSPRVHRDLRARGVRVGKKRVERLMRKHGIAARRKRRFRRTTDSTHPHPIAPNLLERRFDVELPNTAWVTDVTYVWTLEGWLYLAAILDIAVTRRANEAFDVEFERVWQALHLHRRDVCRSYTASEMTAVRRLFRVADAFATILDQKVFVDSDAVTQVRS